MGMAGAGMVRACLICSYYEACLESGTIFRGFFFKLEKDLIFEINYARLELPDENGALSLDSKKDLKYERATMGADKFTITSLGKGLLEAKTAKAELAMNSKNVNRHK